MAIEVTDGIGRTVRLDGPPARIVSLVPSTTETLAALGLADRVVGRTRYCVHPAPRVESIATIGWTKDPDPERVAALEPDLIVANLEENKPEHFDRLAAIAPLYVAYPRCVDDALADLRATARLVGAEAEGEEIARRIEAARAEVGERTPFTYAYMIWRDPLMAVSRDTFVHALLAELGGVNVVADREPRYPTLTLDDLVVADPEVVLLSSEPYPFRAEHAADFGPLADRCRPVDGECCSWHGVRLERAFPYLRATLPGG